ncbi:MAG: DUF3105 domain-containing protein, partial [Longispora sp.]|nr:DUF3105 domain-containing protein [Longispora sp. (in: high G+C Gram-positive bacteria)]
MSYTAPSGEPREPGKNLSGQGKPPQGKSEKPNQGAGSKLNNPTTNPTSIHPPRSAGAPQRAAGGKTSGKAGTKPAGKPGSKPAGKPVGKPVGKAAGKGAKGRPLIPVKVNQQRNWGSIAIFTVVGLLIVGIIGYSGWQAVQGSKTWEDKIRSISGIKDFRESHAKELAAGNGNHVPGRVEYFATPSVGGNHNTRWQNCMGDVYTAQIADEHATHSLEHGAVWITYDPAKVSADGAEKLAEKVRGNDYMLMSPYPGQPSAVSLQAWGYQLQVDKPDDKRIDEFITSARVNAGVEPGAACS